MDGVEARCLANSATPAKWSPERDLRPPRLLTEQVRRYLRLRGMVGSAFVQRSSAAQIAQPLAPVRVPSDQWSPQPDLHGSCPAYGAGASLSTP